MSVCIVCGMESDKLYKCKTCGDRFCEECGDAEARLCMFCLDAEEDSENDKEFEEEEKDWR